MQSICSALRLRSTFYGTRGEEIVKHLIYKLINYYYSIARVRVFTANTEMNNLYIYASWVLHAEIEMQYI